MAYVELNVRTNFTFLAGASHPEEYVRRAAALGHPAVAITDCNSVAGVVRAHAEAKKLGQRVLIGAELQLSDGQCFVALPTDREAYGRLTRLITVGRRRAEKGSCELNMEDVEAYGKGTLFIYLPPEQPDTALAEQLARIALRFPGNVYLAANHLYRGDDARRIETLAGIAEAARVPLVATNDVLMHAPERRALARRAHLHPREMHDRRGRPARLDECRAASEERRARWRACSAATRGRRPHGRDRRSHRLHARRARYDYPDEVSNGRDPQEELERLVRVQRAGALPRRRARRQSQAKLDRELALIAGLRYAPYFLTVHDIVRFARTQGHPLPGARLGGQFRGLLRARHHRGRPRPHRHAVRALRLRPRATSRPTSTSISSTSGARR